jgi:hypothetical protein
VWLSSDQDGRQVAHGNSGVYSFPFAGMPVLVPDDLGVHLLEVGGFQVASLPQASPAAVQFPGPPALPPVTG